MTKIVNFSNILVIIALSMATTSLQAQIKGSKTDEKFGNATVIYKETGAIDTQILAQLEATMGMGDEVRITVAPPKPQEKALAPIKVETTAFDQPAPRPMPVMTASTTDVPVLSPIPSAISDDAVAIDSPMVSLDDKTPQATVATNPVAATKVTAPTVAVKNKVAATTTKANQAKRATTGKTYNNHHKSRFSFKLFSFKGFKKHGKMKYGCYRF